MNTTQFFKKKGPIPFRKIIENIKCSDKNLKNKKDLMINDIQDLIGAKENDITFLNDNKYKEISKFTKAKACITSLKLSKNLPSNCEKLIVENVLFAVTKIAKMFYPTADLDYPDKDLMISNKVAENYHNVFFGNNVLIGKNVKLGDNTEIGSNVIIESNVEIGKNCLIGSNVIIKNSIIEDDVCIQEGSKIGIKGFGFIPLKNKNIRTPHIGRVLLKIGSEVGVGCTISRGSFSDTVIGKNTFLDNQVHVAHNVKIGDNCMIAGQVGFAGSSSLGNNVVIGGQAGVSGHLKIGSNVSIGGGSGVIKNIPDNSKVMGYPAINFKKFIKNWKQK